MNYSIANFLYELAENRIVILKFAQYAAAWGIFVVPLALLALFFSSSINDKKTAIFAFVTVILAWLVLAKLFGHFISMSDPAFPSQAIKDPLFHKNEAATFPSEHASALFGLSIYLLLDKKRTFGWVLLALAFIIGISRIAVGLHTPIDVLAGIGIGTITAILIWIAKSPLDFIAQPIAKFFSNWKI